MATTPRPGRAPLATSPFKRRPEPPIDQFAVGDRVTHDTYGLGWVTAVETHAVTVDFDAQKIRVTSPYAKMHKLES
jgi:hypothetical protein